MIRPELQGSSGCFCFWRKMEKKLKVLAALAADLNESDILWAVGASAMLFLRGIVKEFRDIDLLVCEDDVEIAA